VLDNTILGLELAGTRRGAARAEALTWFPRFGLEGFERAYPSTLSGGMRQRAALLRTFLTKREVLLLDEPFGALDAITRSDMQEWLLDVWESFARTVVLVTHDVDEAIFLADRVYVMSPRPGCIVADLEVPLPRPRSYTDVVTSRPFNELKHKLLARLRGGGDRR
jgi:NitT/TauT family transport system ATP-binding protein